MELGPFLEAALTEATGRGSVAWILALGRVLPTVVLVPAFGLGVFPLALRAAVAILLASFVLPAVPAAATAGPVAALFVGEIARGLPIAVSASVALWAAVVAGGIADSALGTSRFAPRLFRDTPPLASIFGLLAALLFFEGGGVARIAARLATPSPSGTEPFARAVFDLAGGIDVGASLGVPLLVARLLVDLAGSLAAREHPGLQVETVVAPLRTLVVLVAAAALFDRLAEGLAFLGASRP